jgi:hypothetical protein
VIALKCRKRELKAGTLFIAVYASIIRMKISNSLREMC